MRVEGRSEGLLLDLAAFTQPPSPYQVWRGALEEVTNSNEPRLVGKLAVAGYDEELWGPKPEHLPTTARTGKIITRFYQVRADDVTMLGHFQRYLTDPRSPVLDRALVPGPTRRRVVILVETDRPTIFGNPDRFRRRHRPVAVPATASAPDAGEDDAVPPGDAVFQWWCGDPTVGGRGGHWKSYRPHVSARLEEALARNPAFRDCTEAVPIDEVQYCLQRISRDRPFDYLDQNLTGGFRETFLPENVMSVDFPFFDDIARATNNCFVQFQRGNPKRRRPVRRVRRGEAAGVEVPGCRQHVQDKCVVLFEPYVSGGRSAVAGTPENAGRRHPELAGGRRKDPPPQLQRSHGLHPAGAPRRLREMRAAAHGRQQGATAGGPGVRRPRRGQAPAQSRGAACRSVCGRSQWRRLCENPSHRGAAEGHPSGALPNLPEDEPEGLGRTQREAPPLRRGRGHRTGALG